MERERTEITEQTVTGKDREKNKRNEWNKL